MIELIKNIGKYSKEGSLDNSPIDLMLNEVDGKSMKSVFEINVVDGKIETTIRDFYKDVVKDALFYQAGNAAMGGGIRLDFYKESKVRSACDFCEIEDMKDQIKEIVEKFIYENGSEAFAIIKIDGKTPRELFQNKFLDKMYSTTYKKMDDMQTCHLCSSKEGKYNTTTYKFYTNDKSIYGNVDNRDNAGFALCQDCLNNIILGRDYIDRYLSTYWINYKVMFLPHTYDEDSASIYESTSLNEKKETTNFLNTLRLNEEDVIDAIGKTNSITDIIFYEEDSKFFYIHHSIQSVLPSRFTLIANTLNHYKKLKLFTIFNYIAAVKITLDKVETTNKERLRILDAIFSGKNIDRNLFFKRALDVYKYHYIRDEHIKFTVMWTINRIYNFLCDTGCMEKGWNVMETYKNYGELFENNKSYFDTNDKKAWFILGKAYSKMIYYLRDPDKNTEGENKKTSLEKNFFFARKFDFNDFIYFSNLLEDKAIKYNKANVTFKKMMCEAKELMANRKGSLSLDEAKYLFFWGMDSYFNKEKEEEVE